ncbi:alpha-glucoside-specific PTS transporter subunit IIBC [Orbus wheelerorum]|uniref:alpha-glucoside-specific PTS transporter subunit IIBC n=1 Tax=Orbus wheelerorum TaxID=3074111 RepID=UPI00370DBDB4
MLSGIQRFGGAMFTPVLLFPFAGIVVGITILLQNPLFVGDSVANANGFFYKLMFVLQEGAWTVFRNMPLIFCVGLPIGLAKMAPARACLASLVSFLTWNYFIFAMGTIWGSSFGVDFTQEVGLDTGLTLIAGIKTFDTSIIGAIIISGIVTKIHNTYYEKPLPAFLGIFQGTSFIVIVSFFVMLVLAWITLLTWPVVQIGIKSMQSFMISSGSIGVWLYTFLERILIPTGLHHFIYGPFIFGPAVTENGIQVDWTLQIQAFSQTTQSLKELFPAGGFALHGNSKIFGSVGIAFALYSTARPENRAKLAGLLIPATLTAVFVGITEPLEFTFLFIAPVLFAVHAFLSATLASTLYSFGIVGNMGGGLLDTMIPLNWGPMFHNHTMMVITHIIIGVIFTFIWFFVFKFIIIKWNLNTPGRGDNANNVKLYTKEDVERKTTKKDTDNSDGELSLEHTIINGLGGKDNIKTLNNCATRLRVEVVDVNKVEADQFFTQIGAHGVVRKGSSLQIIIGLHVGKVRDRIDSIISLPGI